MDELKPCPFCGGKAIYFSQLDVIPEYDENGAYVDAKDFVYYEYVECEQCGARIDINDDEEDGITVIKWNRRVDNG